ncbi:hypothetical protein ACFFJX_09290 [Pseudarcicella hirudinis]|uniref:hypothetical protein n=1 Tax=Pseudarcicella hirudinis TaxID=1079859 RepID=UPI0035EE53F4
MEIYSVGCAKVEIGDFSTTDGTTTNYSQIAVLKDTVYLNESAPTKNKFFKVGSPSPVNWYHAWSRHYYV